MSKDITTIINKINEEIIKKINTQEIKSIIIKCINKIFIKLIDTHKQLLINNLLKVICYIIYYFNIDNNYIQQLTMNNNQDIFSLLILIMPFYDINTSNNIKTLDELFKNDNNNAKKLSSSYYVDHEYLSKSSNYLDEYFDNTISSIIKTLDKISTKLLPNWRNIFPYDMDNYNLSKHYLYYINTFKNRTFDKYNSGYFYSVIYKFLYIDIKDIKWMIFDFNDNNIITPYIIKLCNNIKINKIIVNKSWDNLDNNTRNLLTNEWISFIRISNNFDIIKSLILFYLRWEYDQTKLSKLKIFENKCNIIIKKKFELINNNDLNDEIILTDDELEDCVKSLLPFIEFQNVYTYIYESIQRFKYTWYGYICMDSDQYILREEDYFRNYENKYSLYFTSASENIERKKFNKFQYVTPKNIYNFFKSLLHTTDKINYNMFSKSYEWDSIDDDKQNILIDRLNMKDVNKWFNISKNLRRIYDEDDAIFMYNYIIKSFENKNSDLLVKIIFETLVYNGMLTYFKYNPKITDNNIIPNKNKEYKKWEKYMLKNVTLNEYSNSYHFFSNKKYSHENSYDDILKTSKTCIDIIKDSKWYTNFGSDWIAQIQLYHHFLNQRVIYVTGATGAGKSTVAPFALLYAVKMLNYNNDAKIVCTVPRIQPAEDNSKQMSNNIGIPINKDNSINYIQFETAKKKIVDDLYHPKLILATDGLLYQRIKSNYLLKKKSGSDFISSNMYDMILIDEAHEHNVYMDMILTLCKFGIYINNQVSLGIISATMDEDELIYRKYFEIIDDNMKWPLIQINNDYDRKFLDRRVHLSVPFGGMNFDVKEIDKINCKPEDIIKEIIKFTISGDILLFLPGRADIIKTITKLNEILPQNVLAIPFYSELNDKLLDRVKNIAKSEIRKMFRYPKNKYTIEDMDKIPEEEILPEGIYKRFIIIATNIAEASITIDTLEYVVDTGTQKINVYNVRKDIAELKSINISKPNQKQRKGRVGRVKPGKFYYTYDINKLDDRVIFKICIENIQDMLYGLYTLNNNNDKLIDDKNDNNKLIDDKSDPNIIDIRTNKKLIFLRDQYLLANDEVKLNKNSSLNNIKYPDRDGRYDLNTLIDNDGKFYIIHPDEDKYERNINLEIIKIKENKYENKVKKIFDNGIINGFLDIKYNVTDEYKLLENTLQLLLTISDKLTSKHIRLLYDVLNNNYDINSQIMNKIILFVIFSVSNYSFDINKKINGNADYLVQSSIIPNDLYDFNDYTILEKNITKLSDIYTLIKDYIENKLKQKINISDDAKKILIFYYNIKLCFKIITDTQQNLLLDKNIKDLNLLYKKNKSKYIEIISVKHYSIYDQLCYFIINNFQSYLLIKISDTDYYVNYKNTDINQIFSLNKKATRVSYKNINRIILALNLASPLSISNIMWIPEYLIDKLKIKKGIYNNKIDKDELKKIYNNNYDEIKQKIEKIMKYVNK
jgi:hypothetical protein